MEHKRREIQPFKLTVLLLFAVEFFSDLIHGPSRKAEGTMHDGTIVSENGTVLRPDGTIITLNKTAVLLNETSVEKLVLNVQTPQAQLDATDEPESPTTSKSPPERDAGTKTRVKPSQSRDDQGSTRPLNTTDDRDVSQQEHCLESSQGNVVRCKSQICTGPTDTCSTTPMMICDHSNSGAKRLLPPVATLKVGG